MADPTDQELEREFSTRISVHLQKRQNSDLVRDLWRGYLQALFEWHIVSPGTFDNLISLVNRSEPSEIRLPFVADIKVNSETGKIISPTADELADRMAQSIEEHGDDGTKINTLWHGYLAALGEWRFLNIEDFDYGLLRRLPKAIGGDEITEIFMGFSEEDDYMA